MRCIRRTTIVFCNPKLSWHLACRVLLRSVHMCRWSQRLFTPLFRLETREESCTQDLYSVHWTCLCLKYLFSVLRRAVRTCVQHGIPTTQVCHAFAQRAALSCRHHKPYTVVCREVVYLSSCCSTMIVSCVQCEGRVRSTCCATDVLLNSVLLAS